MAHVKIAAARSSVFMLAKHVITINKSTKLADPATGGKEPGGRSYPKHMILTLYRNYSNACRCMPCFLACKSP